MNKFFALLNFASLPEIPRQGGRQILWEFTVVPFGVRTYLPEKSPKPINRLGLTASTCNTFVRLTPNLFWLGFVYKA